MILPFINNAVDRQIVGPSRQLYLASVGSSVVLAWIVCFLCQKLISRRFQQLALMGLVSILVWISVVSLKKAEAIDYWLVGRSYVASRNIEKGLTLFDDAYDHGRDILPVTFYTQYAILAFGMGQEISIPLQYALKVYPDNTHVKALMGVTEFISDDPALHLEGQAQIISAIEASTHKQNLAQDLTAALQNAAGYHHKNGAYDRAIKLYQLVLDIRPNYVIAWVNMGRALFSNHLYEKGVKALIRATELQPDHLEAWKTLGEMLLEIGDYNRAISAFQNAYDLNGQQVEFPYKIGLSYEQLGDKKNAVFWYQKALEINPQHIETVLQLESLGY